MEYSAKQEQGHTDVGVTAEMPTPAMPATPDRAGTVGPPAQSQFPWPGREEAACAALDNSAESFASVLAQAQNSPGTVVSTAATAGAPNTGPEGSGY